MGLLSAILLLLVATCCGGFAGRWLLGALLAAFLAQLFCWRWIDGWGWWPGSEMPPTRMLAAAVAIFALALVSGRLIDAARPRALV